jgi:hypothetical protein
MTEPEHPLPPSTTDDYVANGEFSASSMNADDASMVASDAAALHLPESSEVLMKKTRITALNKALFATYFCNAVSVTLPVILMPLIAAEQTSLAGSSLATAAFVASTASVSTLGGGFGKFINGFVCKALGGRVSASLYLTAMAGFHLWLSFNNTGPIFGWILAGLDFCASIQWTACSLILANHYDTSPAEFAAGITILSLASTSGVLFSKIGGIVLLQYVSSWSIVARVGAVVAVVGAILVRSLVTEMPLQAGGITPSSIKRFNIRGVVRSLGNVLGSRIFWLVGLAHATTFLARTSDRVLGSFFLESTSLPRHLCGGLTASVTLGFVHGLGKGKMFYSLKDTQSKTRLLRKNYAKATLSCLALALLANQKVATVLFPSKYVIAGLVALLTGVMASSLSFQFYQIPPMTSKMFGEDTAGCLSFLDGMGCFLSAPIWAVTSQIVGGLGIYGWSTAWVMLAFLFGSGGALMLRTLPQVLDE